MSASTKSAPHMLITSDKRWSIETYDTDDHSVEMLSLILAPAGEDKSTISLHFLGLGFLESAPNGIRSIFGNLTSCLCILPNCTSCYRNSDIIVKLIILKLIIGILSEHEYKEHLLSLFETLLLCPPVNMLQSSGLDN